MALLQGTLVADFIVLNLIVAGRIAFDRMQGMRNDHQQSVNEFALP